MIIRFGCSNYRSIDSYQELLLTASSLKDDRSYPMTVHGFNSKLLPCAAIYGANASGKTNMLRGMRFLVTAILNSHRTVIDEKVEVNQFKLGSKLESKHSLFDIDFILNGTHYHYGFVINNGAIEEEWLLSYSYVQRKSRRVLFHRNSTQEDEYYFGSGLKGKNKQISDLTMSNCLFISVAANSKHEQLGDIYRYFRDSFSFRFSQNLVEEAIADEVQNTGTADMVADFMSRLETGITRLDIVSEELSAEEKSIRDKFISIIPENLIAQSGESGKFELPNVRNKIKTIHLSADGEEITFDLDEESLGTRAAIALLAPLFHTLKHGGIVVIDEIESSLHPLLTLEAVRLYNDKDVNKNNAQLIFSTHETSILCADVLRRDQIWFTEKSLEQATELTPLTDYKIRKSDNVRTGYLDGRFGAIPFFGDIVSIVDGAEAKDD